MRIDALAGAAAVAAQIVALKAFGIAGPWAGVWQLLAYAALTLLAWIAIDGRRPLIVACGALLVGCIDFPAGTLGAALAGGALFLLQGSKACAESSPR